MTRRAVCICLAAWALGGPGPAGAHGLNWAVVSAAPAVVMEFVYSGGEPAAYAAVKVYGPGDASVEHQNGRSDRRGRFAWAPDRPGVWRVVLNDGQGHQAQAEVDWRADAAAPAGHAQPTAPPPAGPDARSVALGLSLIANLGLGMYWFKYSYRLMKSADPQEKSQNNA